MHGGARPVPRDDHAAESPARSPNRPSLRLRTGDLSAEVAARVAAVLPRSTDHRAVVGMVGLGYVGLPFAVEKAKVGFRVIGIDENPERAARVNAGDNYVPDVSTDELRAAVRAGKLWATNDFTRVA